MRKTSSLIPTLSEIKSWITEAGFKENISKSLEKKRKSENAHQLNGEDLPENNKLNQLQGRVFRGNFMVGPIAILHPGLFTSNSKNDPMVE